jgi:hypothetical protein
MVRKRQEKKREEEDWQDSAIGCATDRCGIVHESALLPKGEGSAVYEEEVYPRLPTAQDN